MTVIGKINYLMATQLGMAGRKIAEKNGVEVFRKVNNNGIKTVKSFSGGEPLKTIITHHNKDGVRNILTSNHRTGMQQLRTICPTNYGFMMDITERSGKFLRQFFNTMGKSNEIPFPGKPRSLAKVFKESMNRCG